jgi:hypothetical protein
MQRADPAFHDEVRRLLRTIVNGNAARVALSVLDEHARPTELGKELLQTIRTYLE